jgi:predicted nucleotidyltransferase
MNNYLNYASYFVSYLLNEIKDHTFIKNIILFGSSARGEADRSSDIDIFIEVFKEDKKHESHIDTIIESFYKSREFLIFKNKGVDNRINLLIGKLENWKDLKESIESQGITFYGKFRSDNPSIGKRKIVIFWDKIGKNRGAFLNQVYGFNIKNNRYSGLLEKYGGEKLGKSSIILPIENRKIIFDLLKKYKVRAKFKEIYE